MHPPEVLDTERLRIRKLVEDDAPEIFERWAKDSEITRYLTWSPHTSVEESKAHAKNSVACWEAGTNFTWVMEDRESGRMVGSIAAYPSEFAVELAYLVAQDSWGRGYMVEAVISVSEWFLAQPSFFRVWAEVDTENQPSARVLEKASFTREGMLRRSIISPNLSSEPRDAFIYGRVPH